MSQDERGEGDGRGSDLDIFEGLGKKNTQRPPTSGPAAPPPSRIPPPPGAPEFGAASAATPAAPVIPGKRTLVGVAPALEPNGRGTAPSVPPPPSMGAPSGQPATAPSSSGASNASAMPTPTSARTPSAPPPPPGRATLPPVVPPPPRMGSTPPRSNAPSASTIAASPRALPAPAEPTARAKPAGLDMDWDDEDEATHIFDKDKDEGIVRPGGQGSGAGTPSTLPNPGRTLLGLSSPEARPTMPGGVDAAPPPRATPLPPPPAVGGYARASSMSAQTPGPMTPTGMMEPSPNTSAGGFGGPSFGGPAQPAHGGFGNGAFAPHAAPASTHGVVPAPALPEVSPSQANRMEATALIAPPQPSRAGLYAGLGAIGAALVAGALFVAMMPRTGSVRIEVNDEKGAPVEKVDVWLDGRKACETTPCIVEELSSGGHVVKVVAPGYETPSPTRDVAVEPRKQSTVAIALTPVAGAKAGTGLKVSGNQPGVKLWIDDKEIGALPLEVHDLAPGPHAVKIAGGERYASLEKTVTLAKDETLDLGAQTLKVQKGKATISLAPGDGSAGAKVYLVSGADRRELPTLPIQVDIDTSKAWTLEASKPGMAELKQPISFEDGQAEKTFTVELGAKAAPVAAPPAPRPAPVAAAPRPAAPTPAPAAPRPATATRSEPSGGSETAAGEAFLNINSIPPSSVVLDGKPIGNTPKVKISVKPGSHTVLFVNADEGLKKQVSVTVGAGETKAAIARLRD